MNVTAKKLAPLSLLLIAGLVVAAAAHAGTMAYPNQEHASFMVDLPDGWEIEPGEAVGDYVHVNSPDGVYLAFRTIEGSEDAIKEAIDESVAYIKETYADVEVGEPKGAEQHGLKGFYMDGEGKDKEDKSPVVFRMAWLDLEDGQIGEIWFAAPAGDKGEIAAAGQALSSFRAP